MSACPFDGCLATPSEQLTVEMVGPAGVTSRMVLDLCPHHRRLLEPRTQHMSIGRGPPDPTEAAVRRVLQEWKRAHPRVGDRW